MIVVILPIAQFNIIAVQFLMYTNTVAKLSTQSCKLAHSQLIIPSCIHDYHVYGEVWTAVMVSSWFVTMKLAKLYYMDDLQLQ